MPEHLAAGLQWYLSPLIWLKAPVDELVLTLLLSLRFVGLVFDEVSEIKLPYSGLVENMLSLRFTNRLFTGSKYSTWNSGPGNRMGETDLARNSRWYVYVVCAWMVTWHVILLYLVRSCNHVTKKNCMDVCLWLFIFKSII
jgi:hypothetical protein